MTALAREALVALVRDCVDELGQAVVPEDAAAELDALLRDPWTWQNSTLTASGAPFELSLKLTSDTVDVRYVVDVAEPMAGLRANAGRYERAAVGLTGLPAEVVRRLLGVHTGDAPDGTPATVMLGRGWSAAGDARSTVYVPAAWLGPAELQARLPAPVLLDQPAQVIGYDVSAGRLTAWKAYTWLPASPALLADVAAASASAAVVDAFVGDVTAPSLERSGFRQRRFSPDGRSDGERLFFFADPWGWSDASGLRRVLATLAELGVDLSPLRAVSRQAARHGVELYCGLLSTGGTTHDPSATLYLWPR